jgi:DnaJ-class molecular chaperone
MKKKDYYDVLGVSKTSQEEELKKAYKKVGILNISMYHLDGIKTAS